MRQSTFLETVSLPMTLIKHSVYAGLLMLALSVLTPSAALAIDYKVEIILFEHVNGGADIRSGLSFPRVQNAIGLKSDAAAANGFQLLDSGYEMSDAADEINRSAQYRLLQHFIWQQPGLDQAAAKAVRINVGSVSTVYIPQDLSGQGRFVAASASPQPGREREIRTTTVNGTLKVRLGRFLHLETHLVFTDAQRQTSFNLYQNRKMRSRELHYVDNARFGMLARIVPIEDSDS